MMFGGNFIFVIKKDFDVDRNIFSNNDGCKIKYYFIRPEFYMSAG